MAQVLFRLGTKVQYDALLTKDATTFYYTRDDGNLYLGELKLTSAADVAAAAQRIAQNTSDIADIQTTLEKIEGDASVSGSMRNLISAAVALLNAEIANKTTREVTSASGTSLVLNESTGGGVKFEHTDGTNSYVGVSDGGENGINGQLYAVRQEGGRNVGARLNMTRGGFYYLSNSDDNTGYTAADEIAVKGDVTPKQNKTLDTPLVISGAMVTTVEGALSALNISGGGDASSKTVYLIEASGGDPDIARKYNLYQGSDPSDMSHNIYVGTINVPLSQVLRDAYIVTLIYSSGKLYDGDQDVTRLVKGDEPATLADAGKYMKFVMQNVVDPIYVNLNEFIDIYTVNNQTTEITLAIDASNNLTGTIGHVAATKILFEVAGGESTTVQSEIEDIKSNMTWQSFV